LLGAHPPKNQPKNPRGGEAAPNPTAGGGRYGEHAEYAT
jgi:hypothetical protein